jgi:hypothetical protein
MVRRRAAPPLPENLSLMSRARSKQRTRPESDCSSSLPSCCHMPLRSLSPYICYVL